MMPFEVRDLIVGLFLIGLALAAAEYVTRQAPATPRWSDSGGLVGRV